MHLTGKISPAGGTIRLAPAAAKSYTIWLSPDLVSFEKPLTIMLREMRKYHKVPKSSIADILDDFSARADRQVIFTTRIVL